LQFARARIQFRKRAITSLSVRGTTCENHEDQEIQQAGNMSSIENLNIKQNYIYTISLSG